MYLNLYSSSVVICFMRLTLTLDVFKLAPALNPATAAED